MTKPMPIAITGMGVASPVGISPQAVWSALCEPRDLRSRWPKRPLPDYPHDNVVPIAESAWAALSGQAGAAGARASALAAFTTRQALEAARHRESPERLGCILASTTSGVEGFEDALVQGGAPGVRIDGSAVLTAGLQAWSGPTCMISTACSSGLMAPALACDLLQQGEANAMVAGGLDVLLEYTICGFNGLRLTSPDRCRPFAAGRRGVLLSEGAVAFCLEPLAAARARGAKIEAVITGCGISCDAQHVTAPDLGGVSNAIGQALLSSGLRPSDIGGVFAHGTGTQANDSTEFNALRLVFGPVPVPPITAIKSTLGHPQAAAGAFSLLAATMALQARHLPPTAWLDALDPELEGACVVGGRGAALDKPHLMVNAFGFGGNNCVLIISDPAALEAS